MLRTTADRVTVQRLVRHGAFRRGPDTIGRKSVAAGWSVRREYATGCMSRRAKISVGSLAEGSL